MANTADTCVLVTCV